MHALETVLVYVRPLAVCYARLFEQALDTVLAYVRPHAVCVAKQVELALGNFISLQFHGEHSPRDLSLCVKGLASVRIYEPATPVATIIVLVWANWMAVALRDLARASTLLRGDNLWERLRAPPREEVRAPSQRPCDTKDKRAECVIMLARSFDRLRFGVEVIREQRERSVIITLARSFDRLRFGVKLLREQRKRCAQGTIITLARSLDRLRFGVKLLREQRKRRARRAAGEVRGSSRMAGDGSPPSSEVDDHRGMRAAASSSLPPSALRTASRSSDARSLSNESVRFRSEIEEYFQYDSE